MHLSRRHERVRLVPTCGKAVPARAPLASYGCKKHTSAVQMRSEFPCVLKVFEPSRVIRGCSRPSHRHMQQAGRSCAPAGAETNGLKLVVKLSRSRPTAVNLQDACRALAKAAKEAAAAAGATPASTVEAAVAAGEAYFASDIATCKVMT